MQNAERFLSRIDYKGDLKPVMSRVCSGYDIGEYKLYSIVPIGYEDLDLIVETNSGKYFAKFFASFRSPEDCKRYVDVVTAVLKAGVSHPFLYKSPQGYIYELPIDSSVLRLCVMEYVDGATLYERGEKPTQEEGEFLIRQAAIINSLDFKPPFMYDNWAVSNFPEEFDKKKDALEPEDREVIAPLVEEFRSLRIESLPHAFVHGDIISSNVMKDKKGRLYIIDFSVANWYPRIQELAVLLCDLFFDSTDPARFREKYNWVVEEYQKYIRLTPEELKVLPVFAKAAHAMHVIGASYERSQGNTEGENNTWFNLGRKGLELSKQLV